MIYVANFFLLLVARVVFLASLAAAGHLRTLGQGALTDGIAPVASTNVTDSSLAPLLPPAQLAAPPAVLPVIGERAALPSHIPLASKLPPPSAGTLMAQDTQEVADIEAEGQIVEQTIKMSSVESDDLTVRKAKMPRRGSRSALAQAVFPSVERELLPFGSPPAPLPPLDIAVTHAYASNSDTTHARSVIDEGSQADTSNIWLISRQLVSVLLPPSMRNAIATGAASLVDNPMALVSRSKDYDGSSSPFAEDGVGQLVPSLLSAMIWGALVSLVAIFYQREKQHPPKFAARGSGLASLDPEVFDEHQFRYGLFECVEAPHICLFAVLCGPVRWADTMRMASFLSFSGALVLFVGLVVLDTVAVGIASLALLALLVYYRQRMRKLFKIPYGDIRTVLTDILAYCLCTCCAITQEARQIESAFAANHPAVTPPRQ